MTSHLAPRTLRIIFRHRDPEKPLAYKLWTPPRVPNPQKPYALGRYLRDGFHFLGYFSRAAEARAQVPRDYRVRTGSQPPSAGEFEKEQ